MAILQVGVVEELEAPAVALAAFPLAAEEEPGPARVVSTADQVPGIELDALLIW